MSPTQYLDIIHISKSNPIRSYSLIRYLLFLDTIRVSNPIWIFFMCTNLYLYIFSCVQTYTCQALNIDIYHVSSPITRDLSCFQPYTWTFVMRPTLFLDIYHMSKPIPGNLSRVQPCIWTFVQRLGSI